MNKYELAVVLSAKLEDDLQMIHKTYKCDSLMYF